MTTFNPKIITQQLTALSNPKQSWFARLRKISDTQETPQHQQLLAKRQDIVNYLTKVFAVAEKQKNGDVEIMGKCQAALDDYRFFKHSLYPLHAGGSPDAFDQCLQDIISDYQTRLQIPSYFNL